MTGAEALLQTLIDCGVEVCFANPGTSEMPLAAAIDKIPGMRRYSAITGEPTAGLNCRG